jgi:hypothetical protein
LVEQGVGHLAAEEAERRYGEYESAVCERVVAKKIQAIYQEHKVESSGGGGVGGHMK